MPDFEVLAAALVVRPVFFAGLSTAGSSGAATSASTTFFGRAALTFGAGSGAGVFNTGAGARMLAAGFAVLAPFDAVAGAFGKVCGTSTTGSATALLVALVLARAGATGSPSGSSGATAVTVVLRARGFAAGAGAIGIAEAFGIKGAVFSSAALVLAFRVAVAFFAFGADVSMGSVMSGKM